MDSSWGSSMGRFEIFPKGRRAYLKPASVRCDLGEECQTTAWALLSGRSPAVNMRTSDVLRRPTLRKFAKRGSAHVRVANRMRRGLPGRFQGKLDFENAGPELSGDEQAFVNGVVGDAVQYGFGIETIDGAGEAGEVDPSDDLAGLRRDAGDAAAMPYVSEDLAFHELKFVQLLDWSWAVVDFYAAPFLEGVAIENANLRASIAEIEVVATAGQAPSLAGVGKSLQEMEGVQVVEKACLGF